MIRQEYMVEVIRDVILFIFNNSSRILEYTVNHLSLVLTVLAFSLVLWISVGLIISKYDRFATSVIGLANILFEIGRAHV